MLFKFKKTSEASTSEIVNKGFYLNRRKLLSAASALGGMSLVSGILPTESAARAKLKTVKKTSWGRNLRPTTIDAITSHNNYYEFGSGKSDPKKYAHTLKTKPWSIEISGHVEKPGIFNYEDLIKPHLMEERIYRMRCVEAWSMVIPWVGIPLAKMIKQLNPTSKAKYVAFQTLLDIEQMPSQKVPILDWPYVEGLRIDEAMNPLTLIAVGIFGEEIPNQNGAPLRLVVPWKYGFKGIKSIVKISFVEQQPKSTWNIQAPNEYGFYSNVNPQVDHPRWSQKRERLITGEGGIAALFSKKIDTLMFNGYAEEVADLYRGLDLYKHF